MKSEKGVTLMILIVTVVILIILIATVVQTGSVSVSDAKLRNFTYEMQQIEGAVDRAHQKMVMDPNTDYVTLNGKIAGRSVDGSRQAIEAIRNNVYMDYMTADKDDTDFYSTPGVSLYRYFSISDLDNVLDIKNASSPVVINFKTREVISIEGIKHNNKEYHMLKQVIKK